MSKKIILSVIIALCAAMSGCAAENNEENVLSETETVTQSVISSETTSETTTVTTVETTEASETIETTETAETAMTEENSEKISVKAEDMSFTDFAFIEYYKGSKQEDETSEKAIEFVKTTEEYAQSQKYSDYYKEKYPEYFDENGVLVPKLNESYTEDFDGDGKTEVFLLIDIPYSHGNPNTDFSAVYSFLIFIGNDGNAELIDYNCGLYYPQLLDYGYNKQLVIGGSGSCGAESHTIIWAVRDGKAVSLCGFRGSVYKQDCFVSVFGWQSMGGMMLFDPERCCYIPVDGVLCDKDEIMKMDADKTLEVLYDENFAEYTSVSLIGGKYYCLYYGFMDVGTIYTYSDGRFVPENNSNIRNNHIYAEDMNINVNEVLVDFDYDKVTAEMTIVKSEAPSYSVDDIDEYITEWLKEDYAKFISDESKTYTADEVEITAFYGIYSDFYAVKMSPYDKVLLIGFDISTEKKVCWDIETACKNGIMSESGRSLLDSALKNAE
ncbi:MAG: hypothetical protein ACI4SF_11225 [Oscillospiraceae bacterium]